MMLSVRRDTLDSLSTVAESRRGSEHSSTVLVLPYRFSPAYGDMSSTTVLSPPPPSRTPKFRKDSSHVRLRSDSGLALHTNHAALRQYTEYSSKGFVRPSGHRVRPLSYDGTRNGESLSLGRQMSAEFHGPPRQNRPLPDFFDPEMIRMVFSSRTTGQRMCVFAKSRHCAADMEFLLKVDEYSRAFGNMTSLISQISTNFTGVTATSPLGLPIELSNSIKVTTKHCARSYLPPLERLYRDAKVTIEDKLSRDLYPDFVKFQLTQCMKSSMSVGRSLTGGFKSAYPGLGDAFCITDPLRSDNPIVYASDGLLRMTGYRRREIMYKNCRFLQGIYTDTETTHRIREAAALGRETVELIINHHKDGTPFWNLLFICPLFERGNLRYHLGAQINVSESMGTDYKDILRILNFSLPGEEFPPPSPLVLSTHERPVWRAPATANQERVQLEIPPGLRSPSQRSHRHRFFRRFSRKTATGRPQSPRPVTPPPTAPVTDDAPSAKRRAFATRNPQLERVPDSYSTPYSRFFVMRYIPSSSQSHYSQGRSYLARMSVAFCSSYALETLGLKANGLSTILGHEVFSVLAEFTGSPSITRGLKTTVLEKMAAGESISVDLMASVEPASAKNQVTKHSRSGSMAKAAALTGGTGAAGGHSLSAEGEVRPRLSETLDRGAEILSNIFSGPKMKKMVSHWAPLKDGDGEVAWVVLILTPATAV